MTLRFVMNGEYFQGCLGGTLGIVLGIKIGRKSLQHDLCWATVGNDD